MLAVMAAFAEGTTIIKDAQELKVKESNRIDTVVDNLSRMGADIEATEDGMIIRGGKLLHGAEIDAHADHRIAMSFAVAGGLCDGPLTICLLYTSHNDHQKNHADSYLQHLILFDLFHRVYAPHTVEKQDQHQHCDQKHPETAGVDVDGRQGYIIVNRSQHKRSQHCQNFAFFSHNTPLCRVSRSHILRKQNKAEPSQAWSSLPLFMLCLLYTSRCV